MSKFENLFKKPKKQTFDELKDTFADFTIKHTKINGKTECGRILTKVINPLTFQRGTAGTLGGHFSKVPVTIDMLMYNRNNFRDIYEDKPKGGTRSEYAATQGI